MKHESNEAVNENEIDFVTPDLNRLDEEWVKQPGLYFKHAEELAHLKAAKDRAKVELELAEAEAAQAIRSNPQAFGHEKITEGIVKELIPMQKKVKRAGVALIDAQEACDIAQAFVSALDQKKYALQDAVRLRLANYFSDPRVDEETGGKQNELSKKHAFKQSKAR